MKPIYIGVDTSIFYPIDKKPIQKTIVGFYGSFNPLQGIDKIVRTAHLLRDNSSIEFRIIGTGSTYKAVRALADELDLNNIDFVPDVPYEELNSAINEFDICLGVFGDSEKTDVVIPNKIYHYAAAKKCIITKDTMAVKEVFTLNRDICLVKNDPKEISDMILSLTQDKEKRQNMATAAFDLITENYNQDKIAASFVDFLRTCS